MKGVLFGSVISICSVEIWLGGSVSAHREIVFMGLVSVLTREIGLGVSVSGHGRLGGPCYLTSTAFNVAS